MFQVHDSKRQKLRAWETVRDTLQKLHEKERQIRQLKIQLHAERSTGDLAESAVRNLHESRQLSSYATMQSAARRNAQLVFYSLLRYAFPNFGDQDFKQIFAGKYGVKSCYGLEFLEGKKLSTKT